MSAKLVIAHRGASAQRPENTLPAFELAVEQRADMIETDLHRTCDGAIVLTHDEELPGLGAVETATLEEVRALDMGEGQPVPLLTETLDRFGDRIDFNLEFKRGANEYYEGIEAEVLAEVETRGLRERTLFSSFYDPILVRLRALSPNARIGFLLSRHYPERPLERAKAVGAEALHPEAEIATPELIREAKSEGLAVYIFTVDEPDEMRRFLELGADGLFTNHPDRLRAILDEEK